MTSLSQSLGSLKPKNANKHILMAPRPVRTATSSTTTPTSSPMLLAFDPCDLLEDDDDFFPQLGSDNERDSAETELQMIFGGNLLCGDSSVAYETDSDYYPQSSLYYSDDCVLTNFGLLSVERERSLNPRFDSFPELGASPGPEMSTSRGGVPSRAKNPLAQEIMRKKQQERVQERMQAKENSNKNSSGFGNSPSAVHQLIASLSAVSPPPRHRSYSEPIPFGAASRTEVGSCG